MLNKNDLKQIRTVFEEVVDKKIYEKVPVLVEEVVDRKIDEKIPAMVEKIVDRKIEEKVSKIIFNTVPGIVRKIVDESIADLRNNVILPIADDLHKQIKKNRKKIEEATYRINIVSSKLDKLEWEMRIIGNQVCQNDERIERIEARFEDKGSCKRGVGS